MLLQCENQSSAADNIAGDLDRSSRRMYADKIDASWWACMAEGPLPGFIFGEAIYTIFVLQVTYGRLHVCQVA